MMISNLVDIGNDSLNCHFSVTVGKGLYASVTWRGIKGSVHTTFHQVYLDILSPLAKWNLSLAKAIKAFLFWQGLDRLAIDRHDFVIPIGATSKWSLSMQLR